MNHAAQSTPPPGMRRLSLTTLLLLGSLAIFSVWLVRMKMLEARYTALLKESGAALTNKDTARARGLFETFIRADSTDPMVYRTISLACAEYDQPAMAVEYAQRGLEACKAAPGPERADLYLALAEGEALAEPAHPQLKAIASARAALALDPHGPALLNALAYFLTDNDQNLDEAERLLREALAGLSPEGKDPFSDLLRPALEDSWGWLLYKKGDYGGAVTALSRAAEDMSPTESPSGAKYFYYHLGMAYQRSGQPDPARRALDVALHYDPNFPEAKSALAVLPPVRPDSATAPVAGASL